jgi:TolB-like protein
MPRIAISYRRSDSAGITGRIFDRLVARYGRDAVFMDIDSIPFGTDYVQHIRGVLRQTDVLIAVVGPRWVGESGSGGNRITDIRDMVRLEVETALGYGLTVIPALVEQASMPDAATLPSSLELFTLLNAAPIDSGRDFSNHVDRLIELIDRLSRAGDEQGGRAAGARDAGEPGTRQPAGAAAPHILPPPDKPSIAVLPFTNMSGDPEQEYFADGMVEEIITALSRIRWLFVIARNSTFTYKGKAVDIKQVGRELGVRYVLEGSVRKSGNRVRITGQLIDAATGTHLWADRFDGLLEDIFELQDHVASSVAGVIEPALQTAETARSVGCPTDDLTAYDLYLRAYAMVWSSAARIREALGLVEQAVARDPRYGIALAWAAFCCLRLLLDGQSEDRDADRRKGAEYARRALAVAGDDPVILANSAQALAYFGEDIGAMMALVGRALELNPTYARGWLISGLLRLWAGECETAIEHINVSLRLSPRARNGVPLSVVGLAHFFLRRFDQAVPNLLVTIQEDSTDPRPYRNLAACYAHMGRLDDAREMIARLRTFTPVLIPDDARYLRNPEHRELFVSGLRLAVGG